MPEPISHACSSKPTSCAKSHGTWRLLQDRVAKTSWIKFCSLHIFWSADNPFHQEWTVFSGTVMFCIELINETLLKIWVLTAVVTMFYLPIRDRFFRRVKILRNWNHFSFLTSRNSPKIRYCHVLAWKHEQNMSWCSTRPVIAERMKRAWDVSCKRNETFTQSFALPIMRILQARSQIRAPMTSLAS